MHRNAEFSATDGRANEPYESGVNSTERSERESACTPAKCVSFRNEDLRPYPNVSTLAREVRAKYKQEMNIYQARIIEELTILARAGYRGVLTNKDGNVPDWFEILRSKLGFPIPPDDVEELACLHEIGALRHVVLLESHRKTKHALVIVEGETELTAFLEAYARGARAPWAFRIATPRMIVHAMKKDGALQAPCVAGALADCDGVIALFLFDGDKEGRKAVESLANDLGIPNVCITYDGDVRPPRATYRLEPCDAGLKDPPHGGVVLEDLFGAEVLAAFGAQEKRQQDPEYASFTEEQGHIKITQKRKLAFFRFVTGRDDCWGQVLCLHAKLTGFVQELANRSPAAPTSP